MASNGRSRAWLAISAGFVLFGAGPAAADCVKPFYQTAPGEYPIELTVTRNTPCVIYMQATLTYRKVEIVRKPAKGTAGVAQSGRPAAGKPGRESQVVYIPRKGYTGADRFAIRTLADGLWGTVDRTWDAHVQVVDAP